jgi:hypothetical protein
MRPGATPHPEPGGSSGALAGVLAAGALVLVAGAAAAWFFAGSPGLLRGGASPAAGAPAATSGAIPVDAVNARQSAWLSAQLKGHDNGMASIRGVTITEAGGAYRVTIKNQFGFQCGLRFSPEGSPGELRDCRGGEGWRARESAITLTCEDRPEEEVCKAPYTLVAPDGFGQSAVLQLIRPRPRGQ